MDENTKLHFNTILSKPRAVIVFAAILFLPLIFIGTHTSHDWGDDFAQYIHQAENILKGIPQSETGYIYNKLNTGFGPQAYPIGFPLLLAPVYAIAGNSMLAFTTFISLIYVILGLLMVIFYRNYFSTITSLVLALIFAYNPQMILFKREIMSDIPFAALLVLNFIFYLRLKPGNLKQLIVLALLSGIMLTVRPAGIVFIAAVVLEKFAYYARRKANLRDFMTQTSIFILIPVAFYFLLNTILFKVPSGGSISDYLLFFNSGDLLRAIPQNFAAHIEVFRYLYVPEAGIFKGFSLVLGSVMVAMTLLGFIKRLMQGAEVTEWFFVLYLIMMLVLPNNNSSFRLMVPLGFITLFYAATGVKSLHLLSELDTWKKAVIPGILMFFFFMPGIYIIARSQSNIIKGPQRKSSIEAFNFISKNVPSGSVVVFAKPRALALYTGCKSIADPITTDPIQIHYQVMESRAKYLLIHDELTDETLKRYSRVMQSRLTKQWENKEFILYKINPVSPLTHH
jgi:4-amino-4-deoxy-L-arabinose transferase-like glycosyltransferase